jgi:hypothetical protein
VGLVEILGLGFPLSVETWGIVMFMTNDQAARLIRGIYEIAMAVHPANDKDDIDSRYIMTLGLIAGAAIEALNAVREDRTLRRSQFSFPPREA